MSATDGALSDRVKVILAVSYAVGVTVALLLLLPWTRANPPVLLVALGLPLILRLVPRNWLYGLRTRYTMSTTTEVWYRQNVISGVALVLIGLVWLGMLAARP